MGRKALPAPEFAPQSVGARGTDGAGVARRLRSSPCGANSAVWNRKGERRQNRKFKDCFSSAERLFFLCGKRIDRNIL